MLSSKVLQDVNVQLFPEKRFSAYFAAEYASVRDL